MSIIGVGKTEILNGAQLNELGNDSEADQRAIERGWWFIRDWLKK